MTTTSAKLLLWGPRILGMAVSAFLGLFALDAFSGGKPIVQALVDFTIHLAPALLLLAIVIVAWRWEWLGGIAFIGLAVAYGLMVNWRTDWMLVIAGPLVVVGLLYLWSWRHHAELHAVR
jgi:hypothetical protein